ncbi:MAG TPA: hypothetical protein VGB97_03335 [Candidatus Paceibacterota bacterium]|jgi:hypothetical protein
MLLRQSLDLAPLGREGRSELNTGRFRLGDWAPKLLLLVRASLKPACLEFVIATPAALGHEHGAEWGTIYRSARQRGLGAVPKKLISPLRRGYTEQAVRDVVGIVHSPMIGPGRRPYRFSLHNDGDYLWLRGRESGDNSAFWPGDFRFLFMWDYGDIE